jgi:hypothetical protein
VYAEPVSAEFDKKTAFMMRAVFFAWDILGKQNISIEGHIMSNSTATETPQYFLVGNSRYELPEGSDKAGHLIAGKVINADYVMVVMKLYAGLTHMYDYLPNRKVWVRNTALEDDYWHIGHDSFYTLFREVDETTAHEVASEMRNYSDLVVKLIFNDIADDFLPFKAA